MAQEKKDDGMLQYQKPINGRCYYHSYTVHTQWDYHSNNLILWCFDSQVVLVLVL